MRRLISVGLVVALLLALAPAAMGVLQGLSRGHGAAASASLTCSVKPSCAEGEVAVFRMSGQTNAHAQTAEAHPTTYDWTVCCIGPAGLSTECSGHYDTVLTLSAADNAHVASDGSYPSPLCLSAPYTVMDCQYGASCDPGYACLATISGATNAHVADCDGVDHYATKVCCAAHPDTDGDGTADYLDPDDDNDGCADVEEQSMAFDPVVWYDFYDVPIPANNDPRPNGARDQTVNLQEVVGVLKYVGTGAGGGCNGRVCYDLDKNNDTVPDGQDYDRSPGPLPNPPYDVGPPDGTVNMQDVVMVLKQVGLDCSGPP